MNKKILMTPGPTNVPERVLNAMAYPVMHHRTNEYSTLFGEFNERLKYVFQTRNDVMTFPAAGTGGLEAAAINLFSPGEKIIAVSIGVFGDRFASIAQQFGVDVEKIEIPWGSGADIDTLKKSIRDEHTSILVTHNETSTGAYNDIREIGKLANEKGLLFVVDAVSSLGGLELKMDEWGVDVVISASQKALMSPPGLTFISLSEKAWDRVCMSTIPKYYWDIKKARDYMKKEKPQNPYTPAVSLIAATNESLKMIQEEGIKNVIERHSNLAEKFRSEVEKMGLSLFAQNGYRSDVVTSIEVGEGATRLKREMEELHGIVISGGQGDLKGRIVRIGHMGCVDEKMIDMTVNAMQDCMNRMQGA